MPCNVHAMQQQCNSPQSLCVPSRNVCERFPIIVHPVHCDALLSGSNERNNNCVPIWILFHGWCIQLHDLYARLLLPFKLDNWQPPDLWFEHDKRKWCS